MDSEGSYQYTAATGVFTHQFILAHTLFIVSRFISSKSTTTEMGSITMQTRQLSTVAFMRLELCETSNEGSKFT